MRPVFTVPPGAPFVDALAAGLLHRFGAALAALADVTVLLPTRRACRALAEAFLRHGGGRALLLPRLMPIGDLDEDGIAVTASGDEPPIAGALALPPAMGDLRRRLLLARMILSPGRGGGADPVPVSPAQAAQLADRLGRLLDEVQIEGLSFDRLGSLVPEIHARHWQTTLQFLTILTEHWPGVVAEDGCVDAAERRNLVIAARADQWRSAPPATPVIAAGSTGSIPATAELIEVVADLPEGMVVLPGLDTGLTGFDLENLGPAHPQFGMTRLLGRLGMAPGEVPEWHAPDVVPTAPDRAALINAALNPPQSPLRTGLDPERALDGVRLVTCAGPQEEAGVIALAMRRALEEAGRTAALVTPDRGLARRVAAELRRWGIEIDDSGGTKLAATPPGVFLRLAAEFAADTASPLSLLALFKHPLAAGAMTQGAFRARVRALEVAVLRGPAPDRGMDGLRVALAPTATSGDLLAWFDRLAAMAAPFLDAVRKGGPVGDLLSAHIAFAEALAASDEAAGPSRLWGGKDGAEAASFVNQLVQAADGFGAVRGADYPALFETLMAASVVRPSFGLHPRLHIWGPLEARLQQADLVCLGGLNEGTWPAEAEIDPWLSRPMRAEFGLPSPERRIGLAAHDFVQGFSAAEVLMTRAVRVEGTPTVPSRWLLLLDNALRTLGGDGAAARLAGGRDGADPWPAWQAALDRPVKVRPLEHPSPRPPLGTRPRRLSVTQIETLMRDPYAVYARHILNLRVLDPIDADPGAAERGTIVHEALDRFLSTWPDKLPPNSPRALLKAGREAFGDNLARPGVWAFWWPRFERIASWFAAEERLYRHGVKQTGSEVTGNWVFDAPGGEFTVHAKADRVDLLADGRLSIIDYKTGSVPHPGDIAAGIAPQLPLEAVIAAAGGFDGVPAGDVARLEFWRLSGGDPAGETIEAGDDIGALAGAAAEGVAALIAVFDDQATPYLSRPDPGAASRFSDYGHLARIQEWSVSGGEDAE